MVNRLNLINFHLQIMENLNFSFIFTNLLGWERILEINFLEILKYLESRTISYLIKASLYSQVINSMIRSKVYHLKFHDSDFYLYSLFSFE